MDRANTHLESMDASGVQVSQQMKNFSDDLEKIAGSLQNFEAIAGDFQTILKQSFAPKPAAVSDDIADVLK